MAGTIPPALAATPAVAARSLALLLLLGASAVQAAESVQALRYGVSLYHLYQSDYFESLTELMVGQKLDQLGPHTENAELLRGGVSLSYGMDREAEQIFQALLKEPREGVDRDRAWFYLAKVAWQRGELQRASAALDNVGEISSDALAEEAIYLRAAIALRRGDAAQAENLAAALPEQSTWRLYHAYNMGANYAATEQWQLAAGHFHQFEDWDLYDEELKSLRDRAYTASGYALMAGGDFDRARDDFTRVRLDSPMSDRALLGYGWASVETEDYLAALSPWQVLSGKPPLSQSVRESLLAIPYAYEQLGKQGLALRNYQGAANALQTELEAVHQAIDLFETGDLRGLLQMDVEGSDEWLFGEDILPISGEATYLKHLIASHGFQVAMKEMRDLQRIDRHLRRAGQRLQVLRAANAEQQANWAALIEEGGREVLNQRFLLLQEQVENLRLKIESAEKQDDGRAFADADRLALWQRLERAERSAQALNTEPGKRDLIQIYRGLLIWDDSERFPELRWQAMRELGELETLAQQSREGIDRLDLAIAQRSDSSFAPRIAATGDRIDSQSNRVKLALNQSEQGLRRVAVTELEQQARQLSRSLGQSRLAIARLYDRGSVGASP